MTVVMSADDLGRSLWRLAHEIVESNGVSDLALVGIRTRGVPLAERLGRNILEIRSCTVPVGSLDVSGHRDDRPPSRTTNRPRLPFTITDRTVVLVDDVLFTGRTARAGLDALVELGRPAAVRLAVLIDRGHRQLPVRADHVAKNLPTALNERVQVQVEEIDGVDRVTVEEFAQ